MPNSLKLPFRCFSFIMTISLVLSAVYLESINAAEKYKLDITYSSHKREFKNAAGYVVNMYSTTYPLLSGTYPGISIINDYFYQTLVKESEESSGELYLTEEDFNEGYWARENEYPWYSSADLHVEAVLGDIISVFGDTTCYAGGMAGNNDSYYCNVFNLVTGKKLALDDVFRVDSKEYLPILHDIITDTFSKESWFSDSNSNEIKKEVIVQFENTGFFFTKDALVILYPKHFADLMGYAANHLFAIPFNLLPDILKISTKSEQRFECNEDHIFMRASLRKYLTSATNSPTTSPFVASFDFNAPNDMWSFKHKDVANYDLSKKYFDHLCSRGPWTQNVYMSYQINGYRTFGWRGSCKGMSWASCLFKTKKLKPALWQKNASSMNELTVDNSRDIINYYQFLQYTNRYRNYLTDFKKKTDQEAIRQLETLAANVEKTGRPVLVEFSFPAIFNRNEHAVVAYGVEYGDYTVDGEKYNIRIKTYDINTEEGTYSKSERNKQKENIENSYIYLADIDKNGIYEAWTCPAYFGKNVGRLIGATSDLTILNEYNIEKVTSQKMQPDSPVELKNATMTIAGNGFEGRIESGQGASYIKGSEVSGELPLYTYFDVCYLADDAEAFSTLNVVLPDNTVEYMYDTEAKNSPIDITMMYPSSLVCARAEEAKTVSFSPEGSATMQMNGGEYKLGITMDNALTFLPCQTISVEGRGSKVITIQNQEDALLVSGDNLKDIAVLVLQPNFEEMALKVSTEKSNLLVKPKPGDNSGAIEVFVSKNDDGVYDTKIAETGVVVNAETNTEPETDNTTKEISGKTIALAAIATAAAIGAGVVLIIIIKKKKKP